MSVCGCSSSAYITSHSHIGVTSAESPTVQYMQPFLCDMIKLASAHQIETEKHARFHFDDV